VHSIKTFAPFSNTFDIKYITTIRSHAIYPMATHKKPAAAVKKTVPGPHKKVAKSAKPLDRMTKKERKELARSSSERFYGSREFNRK
jgi:hypothetical protein